MCSYGSYSFLRLQKNERIGLENDVVLSDVFCLAGSWMQIEGSSWVTDTLNPVAAGSLTAAIHLAAKPWLWLLVLGPDNPQSQRCGRINFFSTYCPLPGHVKDSRCGHRGRIVVWPNFWPEGGLINLKAPAEAMPKFLAHNCDPKFNKIFNLCHHWSVCMLA